MFDAPNWHAFYDAVEGRPPQDTLLKALLEGFTIEQFNEEESDGKTALGDTKHWHTFAVVAVKR